MILKMNSKSSKTVFLKCPSRNLMPTCATNKKTENASVQRILVTKNKSRRYKVTKYIYPWLFSYLYIIFQGCVDLHESGLTLTQKSNPGIPTPQTQEPQRCSGGNAARRRARCSGPGGPIRSSSARNPGSCRASSTKANHGPAGPGPWGPSPPPSRKNRPQHDPMARRLRKLYARFMPQCI